MKIAILGTRGIPNNHGGFEQFAEYFSLHLANNGHEVVVYNSHNHPFQGDEFQNVKIVHCYDPEYSIGTAGQFIYDFNCILDIRKRNFDIILQLGYTSSSIWYWLLPKSSIVVTNMDGLEWKRTKYKPMVRKFLKFAEKLAAEKSNFLISDSLGIKDYLLTEYNKESEYIAYGANNFDDPSNEVLKKFELEEYGYSIVIARLEPENNIETIVNGYVNSEVKEPLIIFGGINTYGKSLIEKYKGDFRIKFVGPNYNQIELNNLRYYSRYYFHGHSVGGTNPSLLEAMASNALIIANNNMFNKSILEDDAMYFKSSDEITLLLNEDSYFRTQQKVVEINRSKIERMYNWSLINSHYEKYLISLLK